MHDYVSTTNIKNGKMLYANNENNFAMAQHLANITQQEVILQIGEDIPIDDNNVKKAYRKVFKPNKTNE